MHDTQAPANGPGAPKRRHSAPLLKRISSSWRNSSVYAFFWRLGNALYNWWYPCEPDAYGAHYGRRRISRPRHAWRHFSYFVANSFLGRIWSRTFYRLHGLWYAKPGASPSRYDDGRVPRSRAVSQIGDVLGRAGGSGLFAILFRLRHRLYDWWFPVVSSSHGYAGYGGRRRVGRLTLAWQYGLRLLRKSILGRGYAHLTFRLYEWWHPNAPAGGYGGYSGRRRLSRPVLLLSRASAWLRHSFLGREFAFAAHALYEWWYPATTSAESSGGYARRRKSRPAILLGWFARTVRESWVGHQLSNASYHLHEWWYPPPKPGDLDNSISQYRRASRPVLFLRRWNRKFRSTWLGREFGWLLDEGLHVVLSVRDRVRDGLEWENLRQFFFRPVTIISVLILCGVIGTTYYYGWPKYRRYLEHNYAIQAQSFLAKGDLMRANLRARQALAYNPEDPQATWVHAEIADRVRAPQALYWRQRCVVAAPFASNRLALAATALRVEEVPFPTATRALAEIAPGDTNTLNYQMVAGALAIRLSDLQSAQDHFQAALNLEPSNPAARMSLAVVRLQSKDPEAVKDSRTTLGLLSSEGKLGILPLRSLVAESFGRRDFDAAEKFSGQVLTNAQASFSDSMLHLAILKAAGRTNFQAFLDQLRNTATNQPAQIGELAAWMNQSGYAAEARDWLTSLLDRFTNQPMLRLALADSYVALKQWSELQDLLDTDRWPGLEHVRLAMLSYATRQQGTRNKLAWDRALSTASGSPAALNTLARMAENWGWLAETEQVLWEALEKYPTASWPSVSLHRLLLSKKDSQGFRRLFQTQTRNNPQDPLARNNYAMLSLLLGKDIESATIEAQRLHLSAPTNATFASTYAFALHLQGKTREGLEVLRSLKPGSLAEPSVAVYYGILLSAAGEKQLAKTYLDKSEQAFLLPQERSLLDIAKKSL